jgi:branched-chain amino acid transport system substrate-binding protein
VNTIRTGGRRAARTSRAGAGLAALAALVTACGASGAGAAGTPGPAGTPITIGLMVNVSGPAAEAEASAGTVFQAWAAQTNATGGIAGHPVKLVIKDTRGDAPTAAAAAEDLISDDSVDAVVQASATTDGAVGQLLSDSGLPVVGGEGYNPQVWGALKNWFGITTTFPQIVNLQVAAGKNVGAATMSVVACAEDPSCVAASPLYQAAAAKEGTTFTGNVQVAAAAPNYTAQCLDLINRRVDFVQLSVVSSVGVRVVRDCDTQGYGGYFGASGSSVTANLYDTPGIKLAGGLNAFPWWVDDAPVQHFREVMTARKVDQKDWAQPAATAMWATGELFTKALGTAAAQPDAQVTRQTVLAAYGAVSQETLGGLLPQPITFTANQPAGPVNCYWLYQYENGSFHGRLQPSCPS